MSKSSHYLEMYLKNKSQTNQKPTIPINKHFQKSYSSFGMCRTHNI